MGKYETPKFDLLEKEGNLEIRTYKDFYIVEYENDKDPSMNSGFRTLFNYISSGNVKNEKISMTVPVIQEESHDKKKMAFVVPAKFGHNIPEPNSSYLKVKKFQEGLFGVIKYGGLSNKSKEAKMKKRLNDWLEEKNYQKQSNYMLAFYNGPFTPPMFRKNEIMVGILLKS